MKSERLKYLMKVGRKNNKKYTKLGCESYFYDGYLKFYIYYGNV